MRSFFGSNARGVCGGKRRGGLAMALLALASLGVDKPDGCSALRCLSETAYKADGSQCTADDVAKDRAALRAMEQGAGVAASGGALTPFTPTAPSDKGSK